MEKLTFAIMTYPGHTDLEVLILAGSIRVFGGELADSPIWVAFPEGGGEFSETVKEKLVPLDVRFIPFEIDRAAPRFPFAAKVRGAAVVEFLAQGQTDLLTWLDPDTIVIRDVDNLLLEAGKTLGYRPVHHTVIGSVYDEPVDPFWQLIYRLCSVPEDRLFPMEPCVHDHVIRPYFNAGSLVVRPERGLLQLWSEAFHCLYREACFTKFYEQDERYAIFAHQAILTGVLLSCLHRQDMQELAPLINYPLHLHDDYPADCRPASLNDLITCRYEEVPILKNWRGTFPVREPLAGWLDRQLSQVL